ncbi:FK506-binding protein 59 isoform X2 [Fopius arisanus]|nr:PREDICTED: FK506-binding protein 59-like isoform X2 [Fopius arisanus]
MAVDISPEKNGGILKEITKNGEGVETPSTGCKVVVHYTGKLLDGSKFDSSKDRNQPFSFNLGRGEVIQAWDIGVATMKKGEVAVLTCAPEKAYGKGGMPPKIPPNSVLVFEIEVLSWTGHDISRHKDGSIEKFLMTAGHNESFPTEGSLVDVHVIGKYNGEIFEERDVEFNLGEGEEAGIIEGIEDALENFKSGETSRLKINSKYAFGSSGNKKFNIPSDADVEYIVTLKSFEQSVDIRSLEPAEKLQQAKIHKDKATNYFKAGKYQLAIKICKKAEECLELCEDAAGTVEKERDTLRLSTFLNLALFYLKNGQYLEAKGACDSVLKLDPQNEKGLFRRGQAHVALASPEVALQDFQEVLKIEPKNTAALKEAVVCQNLIQKNRAREKKLYANMFDKFAQADKQ